MHTQRRECMLREDRNVLHRVLLEHSLGDVSSELVLVKCCTMRGHFLVQEIRSTSNLNRDLVVLTVRTQCCYLPE